MRNRFLAADYFTASGAVQTLDFIRLPPPHLPPPNNLSLSQHFLLSFHDIPVFSITYEIEKLQTDHALFKFFSDVLPHVINEVNFSEQEIGSPKGNRTVLISENETTPDHGGRNIIEITQFEIPEMDLILLQSQESTIQSQMEDLDILSQSSVADCTMDLPTSDISLPNLLEVQQLFYSVDDISLEYSMEQKADFLEDAGSFEGELHSHNLHFSPFEVDEESLGIVRSIYMEDELLDFENIEPQHWTETDVVVSEGKELLSSIEFDFMKYLSEHFLAVHCLEVELHCSNFSSQMDYLSVVEQPYYEDYSTFHQGKAGGDIIGSKNLRLFEEFQFSDQDPSYSCEFFSDAAKEVEAEPCEFMFGETMNFMNYGELIVCHELTLMDDSFKSLPVPIISGHESIRSLHSMVEQILTHVESQSSSTSDGLYLDWHVLEEENFGKYSFCRKMPWDIDKYKIDASMYLMDSRKLIYDFILSKDCSDKTNSGDCKEMLNLNSAGVSMFHTSVDEKNSDSLHNHGDRKMLDGEMLSKKGIEKVPSFVESMSSDLDFFLNPRNYVTGKGSKPADKLVDIITPRPLFFSNDDSIASNATTTVQQQWNVRLHRVQLSENILLLIDNFRKVFLALLENDTELIQSQSRDGENLTVLCLPKEELVELLKKKSVPSTYSAHNNDNIMLLMMLCAIKQMAFYLCYYGVHATYLYVDKLCRSLQCLKSRLSCLYDLIKDANERAEKEICEIHPSLSVVQEILQTNLNSSSLKILIVADQVFWWPLKRLLTSMKISYNELHNFSAHASQQDCDFTNTARNTMIFSDCCLVSYEYVSASFPFREFGFVLEYGGSNGSSIISTICPKLDQLPPLYFLKVELEASSVSKALSDGVYISKNSEFKMDADIHSISAQNESKNKLEDLLNFVPIEETYNKGLVKFLNEDEVCSMIPVKSMPVAMKSKEINSCKPHPHDIVIIVNTQNFDKEMIISRRRTYQRILTLEKEGAQVVERDIDLPVDIIVSAAVCLAWYDCRNIGKKGSAPDEAFSCLPLCIESIASSTLTSLSFAFSCCILIFEGEGNFLSEIMESSDELYAAAASLGIDIQLFCSFSSEMTDEIILSCIEVGIKSHRGLCPKMPDSESLAESFLTAFPSINPLSAHAILSSGGTLVEFLELSAKDRTCALHKSPVPDESIDLLSATIRYGVREDSKSGMTDCSSSVSSAPDSETAQFRSVSNVKKLKYNHNLYDATEPPNDLFHMEPLKLFSDDLLHPPKASTSCDSWLSGSTEKFDESWKSSLTFDDKLFRHSQGLDIDAMMNSSTTSRVHDFPGSKNLEILSEMEKPTMAQIGVNYDPRWRSGTSATINFSRQNTKASEYLQENLIGEVIDMDDTPAFRNYVDCSPFMLDGEKGNAAKKSRMSKPSSGVNKIPVFTDPVEIDSASDACVSIRDSRKSSREEIREHFDTVENNKISLKSQKKLFQEDMAETNSQNSYKISFQERGPRNYGGTPLSNALRSTEPQQGSPWTIEFLNRIREKSRLRQQSLPCNLSSPCFNYSRNASKVTKRKSPSILEFYKYQGGSVSEKIVEEKRQRRSLQQSNSSKKNKGSASCNPSLTPVDKRASRTLSFATNGNGGQSKLIWSDKSSHTSNRRF